MSKRKWTGTVIVLVMVLCLVLCMIFLLGNGAKKEKVAYQWPQQEEFEGVLCSMYDMTGFTEENFKTYRGLQIACADENFGGLKELCAAVEAAIGSGGKLEEIYLGIDPYQVWQEAGKDAESQGKPATEELLAIVEKYPETTFEILLPAPQLSFWTEKSQEEAGEALEAYESFAESLGSHSNLKLFFLGGEEWLICNKDNFISEFGNNTDVAKHIFLATFCDGDYLVTAQNIGEPLEKLKAMVDRERESETVYPDLAEYTVVFLGDSIIGTDRATTSIPGVTQALSGAKTYNIGEGGLTATRCETSPSFLTMVEALEKRSLEEEFQALGFAEGLRAFLQEQSEEHLIFVINFGLNDYFQGKKVANLENPFDENTYAGALRTGIKRLKETYPGAEIVVTGPSYITYYAEGNEALSEEGGSLQEYIAAAQQVAEESGVLFKNNYLELGVNGSNADMYLSDGCHLNHQGRFLYGTQIVAFIEKNM